MFLTRGRPEMVFPHEQKQNRPVTQITDRFTFYINLWFGFVRQVNSNAAEEYG